MKSLFDDTMAMMPMGGVTALHASPYRFGRFSDEFNLKGEGANVYTRGHYLAENIKTAMEYLKDFATGKKFNYTKRAKDKYDPQIDKVDKAIWKTFSDLGYEESVTKIMDMKKKLSNLRLHKEYLEKRRFEEGGSVADAESFLYKVDVPDHKIGDMLDWDKRIHKQKGLLDKIDPERTLLDKASRWRASEKAPLEHKLYPKVDHSNVTGADFITYLERNKKMKGRFDLENWLKSRGVPGVKYLDAGSRPTISNWNPTKQSHNYVVYDPNDIKILDRKRFDPILGLPK